ncbi:MAG: chromosome segregation ATPase [Psychroserpens sp.]|jgi:chromosome segregation ATPase
MFKVIISQIERIDTLLIVIIGLIGWVFFLLTYIYRRRSMQKLLERLERDLKKKNEEIRNLESQLEDLRKSKTNSEKEIKIIKTHHPDLTSAIQREVTDINQKPVNEIESFERELLFTEYESNYFAKEKGRKKGEFNNEVVYRIILETESEGTFELVNKENDDYILNKDLYLLSGLCSLNYGNNSSRKKIGAILPGKVHLESDKWMVDEKVQIEIL